MRPDGSCVEKVTPAPSRRPASPGYSGCEFRLLLEFPEGRAPELVRVRAGAEQVADLERETGEVGDDELRTRLVGREGLGRVGQNERGGEVGGRAVDQRNVPVLPGVGERLVKGVQDL